MPVAQTLFDKIWDRHVITRRGEQCLLYIDRHIVHDGSFHAFANLRARGIKVRRPRQTFGTPDHYVPTWSRKNEDAATPEIGRMLPTYIDNMRDNGVVSFPLDDIRQGIVHVVGPEQGITLPGIILVCGDSHTASHGALGAFAFGIGQSENEHVLATQTVWQTRPRTMRISIDGVRAPGISAKDVILAIIARIGTAGAVGHAIEYAGQVFRAMSIEERLTVCNMSIECGSRTGMIAPDDATYAYLAGRPYAPQGAEWDRAVERWRKLPSDAEARFDREVRLDAGEIAPMVTWGTSPEQALPIDARVPDPAAAADTQQRAAIEKALAYIGLAPGTPLTDIAVDRVFIGSCTNSRIEDLRAAAQVARGRKARVPTLVVPGSGLVKRQAEAEGLDRIFTEAGFEWRHAGCSMCVGMNGDLGAAGQRVASTSNRNFEGRQGKGVRTHLMSPAMAAAAAVTGRFTDIRRFGAN
ncbi:MAG: 3-isopropylmalate dehydratase large subunit [Burkholderiales bacterium]|nr:3-isopropylmalate dehydratase large subunit [Burkholderiales bacterium]